MNFKDLESMFNMGMGMNMGNARECKIEVWLGTQLVQSENLNVNQNIAQQNYFSIIRQIVADKSKPLSVRLSVKQDIYDDNDNFVRTLWNSVESANYDKWEKEK